MPLISYLNKIVYPKCYHVFSKYIYNSNCKDKSYFSFNFECINLIFDEAVNVVFMGAKGIMLMTSHSLMAACHRKK